ncbi:hypothetical protein OH733_05565 [Streptomyces griseus]|uniref:hypothetical protein n=1 Tax=Streptomyces griseus TaxID=1911 RepID=UPI00386B9140|nr:hypothetical protein OH733_05565 [Streptomyces griseus]WTD71142.1 hypothetical protein OH763_31420 [Streptomyces griseus]
MADDKTTTQAPAKKATRKPDPMTRIIADMKEARKALGAFGTKDHDESKRRSYDQLAASWGRDHAITGEYASGLLSLTFEAAACYKQEKRYALLQLAAAALAEVERLDGAE